MAKGSRRQFLQFSGYLSVVGLAGCVGGESGDEPTATEQRTKGWCLEELSETVPERYRTAESIDGIQRNPDEVATKADADYQCHPEGYQRCTNCKFYVQDQTGDDVGACTVVEGEIRSQDWCALYETTDELDETPDPDPLDDEEGSDESE